MTDTGPIQLEPTEGERTGASAGERLLVGLAALVLGGGALIGVFSALDGEPEIAAASPSGSAAEADRTPRPSRSPRPSPTPRVPLELVVEPGEPPAAVMPEPGFYGWIRATADVPVLARPAPDARQVGTLASGELAYAGQARPEAEGAGAEWFEVYAPGPSGWVAAELAGEAVIDAIGEPQYAGTADVWSLTAMLGGFVMEGWMPSATLYGETFTATSSDGAGWELAGAEMPSPWRLTPMAVGPAGLIAIEQVDGQRYTSWLRRSHDGRRWSSMGGLRNTYPTMLVGSEVGYLMVTQHERMTLWFSEDGLIWSEIVDSGLDRAEWLELAATRRGFFAWDASRSGAESRPAHSRDGRAWSMIEDGPVGGTMQVVDLPDTLLAIDTDPQSNALRVWHGDSAGLDWRSVSTTSTGLDGVAVTTLVGDGERAMAFGWDRATEEPVALVTSDGSSWRDAGLASAGFGGIPRVAAAGPAGFVVVGYRPTLMGANPIVWRETADGSWAPEPDPLIELVPEPAPDACPAPPADALEFAFLDRQLAVACFGDAPLTFLAWATACDWCGGDPGASRYEPGWLAAPDSHQIYLSPIASEMGTVAVTPAVLHPSLDAALSATGQWVELIGHFDDPEAQSCRWRPGPAEERWYAGRQSVVDGCRTQFVVTGIEILEES